MSDAPTVPAIEPVVDPPGGPIGVSGDGPSDPWLPGLLLLAGPVVLALVALAAPAPVRALPVLGYLAVVPGVACVRLVRPPNGLTLLVLGVALSLALGVLVAQGLLYLHRWSPPLGLGTLVGVASLAALVDLLRGRLVWRPQPPRHRPPARSAA